MDLNALLLSVQGLADPVAGGARRPNNDGDARPASVDFGTFLTHVLKQGGSQANSTFSPGTAAASPAGRLEGFDAAKLANTSHQTLKYEVGRILQQYPNTPQGLQDALPAIQSLVPGARITGSAGDKLDFGTYVDARQERIGVVDVLRGASTGGLAWQWQPVE